MFFCQPRPNRTEQPRTHPHPHTPPLTPSCSCKHTTHVKCNKRVYQFCTLHAAHAVHCPLDTAVGMPMSCQTEAAAARAARAVKKSAIAWQLAGKDPQKWSTSMGIYKKCKFIRAAVERGVEFWLKCWLKKVDKENEKVREIERVRERERESEPTCTNFDWRPCAAAVNVSGKASKVQRHCIFSFFCFCWYFWFFVFSFASNYFYCPLALTSIFSNIIRKLQKRSRRQKQKKRVCVLQQTGTKCNESSAQIEGESM